MDKIPKLDISGEEQSRLIEILSTAKTATGSDIPFIPQYSFNTIEKDKPNVTSVLMKGLIPVEGVIPTDPDEVYRLSKNEHAVSNLFEAKSISFQGIDEKDKALMEKVFGSQVGFENDSAYLISEISVKPMAMRLLDGNAAHFGAFTGLVGGGLTLLSTVGNTLDPSAIPLFAAIGAAGVGGSAALIATSMGIDGLRDKLNGDERAEMLNFVSRRLEGDQTPWMPRVEDSNKIKAINGPANDYALPKIELPEKTMEMSELATRVSGLFDMPSQKMKKGLSL